MRQCQLKLRAYDIFTHQKYKDVSPVHAIVEVPVVTRKEILAVGIDDGGGGGRFLSLLVLEAGRSGRI